MDLPVVTEVKVVPFTLDVTFKDGKRQLVEMDMASRGGVLEPLKDREYFAKGFGDDELGTVCWPNGADVAPERLYEPDPVKWQQLLEAGNSREKPRKTRKRQNARL